jgi:transposase
MTPRKQQRERALFHTYNLDDLVPENHILRKIDRVIDFSFVRDVVWDCYCHTNGRPGTDPELIVRMILIGYLYGLSENRLSDEVRMHAAYRLFCQMDSFDEPVPDRSTINKLRNVKWAGKEVFVTIMRRIVQECVAAGLVKGTHMSVDGTQIHADASVKSIEPITPVLSLDDYLNSLGLGENAPSVTPATPPAPAGRHPEDKDFHGEKWSNDTHRSTTDPEAMLCKKSKEKSAELSYFGHELIDTRSRVILDILATQATGTAEREAALNMLDTVEALKLPGSPKFLVADTKYGSGDFLADLLDRNIIPHIPLLSSSQLEPIPCWKRKTNNPETKAKRDKKVREAKARNAARFLAHTKAYLQSQALRKRSEHSFAEGKQQHGLGRARYRGLSALQDQLYGIASVQNLKRLVSFQSRKKAASGSAAGVSVSPIAANLSTQENYSLRNAVLSSFSPFRSVMEAWGKYFFAVCAITGNIKQFLFPIPFSISVSVRFS